MHGTEILEQGTVVEAYDTCLVVQVDGVEVFVGTRINYSAYGGDTSELTVSYNRPTEDRVEEHGDADPLGIE